MNRKTELSFLNVFFCLVVIFIHIASAPLQNRTPGSFGWSLVFVPWRLSAFVVQGFIFLSGLKLFLNFKNREKTPYLVYMKSRLSRIYLPYVGMVLIFYVFFLCVGWLKFDLGYLAKCIVTGELVSHFYFVAVIMQFYFLRPLWEAMVRNIPPARGVLGAFLITLFAKFMLPWILGGEIPYGDRIFTTYLIYWVLGCWAGCYYDKVKVFVQKYKGYIFVSFVLVSIIEIYLSWLSFSGKAQVAGLEFLHIIYCIFAIALSFALALKFGKRMAGIKLFERMDKVSYYIYLVHPLVIFIFMDKPFLIRAVMAYAGTFLVCEFYLRVKRLLKDERR